MLLFFIGSVKTKAFIFSLCIIFIKLVFSIRRKDYSGLKYYLPFFVCLLLMFGFYYIKCGRLMPTTNEAKAVFYSVASKSKYIKNIIDFFTRGKTEGDIGHNLTYIPFIFLPFYLLSIVLSIKQKRGLLLILIEVMPIVILTFLYFRLPRLYQHARYLVPFLPGIYLGIMLFPSLLLKEMSNERSAAWTKNLIFIALTLLLGFTCIWIYGWLKGSINALLTFSICYYFIRKRELRHVFQYAVLLVSFVAVLNIYIKGMPIIRLEQGWIRDNQIAAALWLKENTEARKYNTLP